MTRKMRRMAALALVCAAISCRFPSSPTEQRADRTAAPSAAGQPASLGELIDAYFESNPTAGYEKVRAVIVMLDGQPAVEQYYDSDAGTAMDLYDATTSVVSILVGIALDEGHLTSLEQPLSELLPSYADVMPPEVAVATLRSVLTMTAGFRGNPDANQTVNLPTEDWLPLILSVESRVACGTFTFSSEGAHLLSAIVAEATGRSTLEYAREKLFEPLGIDTEPAAEPLATGPEWNIRAGGEFTWFRDPNGYHLGYGHLAMTAPDMAKIGQLFLDGGQ